MTKKFNNVDSIIFDLDGTLWDSRKEVASAYFPRSKRFDGENDR